MADGINFVCQPERPLRRLIGSSMQATRQPGEDGSSFLHETGRFFRKSFIKDPKRQSMDRRDAGKRSPALSPESSPVTTPQGYQPMSLGSELPRIQKTARGGVNMAAPQRYLFTSQR